MTTIQNQIGRFFRLFTYRIGTKNDPDLIELEDGKIKLNGNIYTPGDIPFYGCRAHAHVLSDTADDLTGTYARVGTTVTITCANHGFLPGHRVYCNFTSGTAADGLFPVATVPDKDTLTVIHGTSGSTSGNVTIPRVSIVSGGNISSVIKQGTGSYYGNMTVGVSGDNLLTVVGSAIRENDLYTMTFTPGPVYANSFAFWTKNASNNNADGKRITFSVFG